MPLQLLESLLSRLKEYFDLQHLGLIFEELIINENSGLYGPPFHY